MTCRRMQRMLPLMALLCCSLADSRHPQSRLGGDDFGRGVLGGVDLDRDGAGDVFVLEGGWDGPECVWVFSGRTGGALRRDASLLADASEALRVRTMHMAWVGDVDADGTKDYAYDLGEWIVGGRIVIRSGRTGTKLWEYPERREDGSHSMTVALVGDVDRDGALDFAVGMPGARTSVKNAGKCVVVSGRSRRALAAVEGRVENAWLGYVCPLSDLDGDGRREFVLWSRKSGEAQGAVGLYRGADASLAGWLGRADGRALRPTGVTTGYDWNADGVDDVFVGCHGCSRATPDREEVHIFSGKDRSELLVVPEPVAFASRSEREEFGRSVVLLRSGVGPESARLVVGAYNTFPYGILYAFDRGLSGASAELRVVGPGEFEIPAEVMALEELLHIGGALANAGDLDGDGADDLLVSSTAYCTSQRGVVWALSGKTGSTLFRWHRRGGVEAPVLTVGR